MERQFDLVVVGTGVTSAVASRCREAGWSVGVVDSHPFGGTCALRGCIPKKTLVGAAEAVHAARDMADRGVPAGALAIDWPPLMRFKRSLIDPATERTEQAWAKMGVGRRTRDDPPPARPAARGLRPRPGGHAREAYARSRDQGGAGHRGPRHRGGRRSPRGARRETRWRGRLRDRHGGPQRGPSARAGRSAPRDRRGEAREAGRRGEPVPAECVEPRDLCGGRRRGEWATADAQGRPRRGRTDHEPAGGQPAHHELRRHRLGGLQPAAPRLRGAHGGGRPQGAGLTFRTSWQDTSGWFNTRRVGETTSGSKVLIEQGTDRIVGAHLLGPHADEVINLFAMAIRLRIPAGELKQALYAYPTYGSDIRFMI